MAQVSSALFKKYDIRGIASENPKGERITLNRDVAYQIGLGIGTFLQRMYQTTQVVVGRDNRHSSPELQDGLIGGLLRASMDVIDIGLVSTPLVYWHAVQAGDVGGVMVTGSHLAPHYNGFKISVGSVNVYDHALQTIAMMIADENLNYGAGQKTVNQSAYSQYVHDIEKRIQIAKPLKVVIDPGNGTGGLFAPRLLELWGQDVTAIHLQPDGDYPNHPPNPQEEANVRELGMMVREVGADIGIAFDGDADRIGVVDENGALIPADRILALLARDMLTRQAGASVVADVLCSQVLFDAVSEAGGTPYMAASGHSIVKDKMRSVGALLGGEMSGHIFMGEDYFGFDDGYFVMGRVLQLLANHESTMSSLDDTLPRLFATPEYRPACPDIDKAHVIQGVAQHLATHGDISTEDGVRLQTPNGWGILRASNTEPVLSLRFEGKDEASALALRDLFAQALTHYPQVATFV
jgi:phosphomannomutase/phosphoglucomutase